MFNEIKKEENKEEQGNIITPNLNNDKKVTEGVNDMFSDLDTGARPSAIQSGKIGQRGQSVFADKECIIPEGSDRLNHRQDQAILSILYYRYHNKKKRIKYQNYLLKSGKFFKYVTKMNNVNKRIKKYKKKESIINSIKKISNLVPSNSDDMDGFLFF